MYYEEYGDKNSPLIIFLHGAMVPRSLYNQKELSDSFRLIYYTFPGHGFDYTRDFDRQAAIDDILRIINESGKKKAYIAGFSLGAQVALKLLNDYPDYAEKAVLISPLVYLNKKIDRAIYLSAKLTGYATKIPFIARLVSLIIGINKKDYPKFRMEQKLQSVKRLPSFIVKDMLQMKDLKNLKDIDVPVMLYTGKKETGHFKNSTKILSGTLKNCRVEICKKASHNIPWKCRESLNKKIRDFFS